MLIGGELDVAVIFTSTLNDKMALQTKILEVSPYRLWLTNGPGLVAQDSIALDDLTGGQLIMLDIDEKGEAAEKLLSALGTRPWIGFRTRSVEAVRSLAATGAGSALLPDLVYRPWLLEGDRIVSRGISGSLPAIQVDMAWR